VFAFRLRKPPTAALNLSPSSSAGLTTSTLPLPGPLPLPGSKKPVQTQPGDSQVSDSQNDESQHDSQNSSQWTGSDIYSQGLSQSTDAVPFERSLNRKRMLVPKFKGAFITDRNVGYRYVNGPVNMLKTSEADCFQGNFAYNATRKQPATFSFGCGGIGFAATAAQDCPFADSTI